MCMCETTRYYTGCFFLFICHQSIHHMKALLTYIRTVKNIKQLNADQKAELRQEFSYLLAMLTSAKSRDRLTKYSIMLFWPE